MDRQFAGIRTELSLLKLMVGGLYALLFPGLWLLLRVAYKGGALG